MRGPVRHPSLSFIAVASLSAVFAAAPAPAQACSYEPDGTVVPATVPLNGAVRVERHCLFSAEEGCPLPEVLEVYELESNTLVEGSWLELEPAGQGTYHAAYWKPAVELTQGKLYELRNAGDAQEAPEPPGYPRFSAGPRLDATLSQAGVIENAESYAVGAGEAIACRVSDPCDPGLEQTIYTARSYLPQLQLVFRNLPTLADSNAPVQYSIRTTCRLGNGETLSETLEWGETSSCIFGENAGSYCYKSVVRSFLDDQEERTFEGCLPNTEFDVRQQNLSERELAQALYWECEELLDASYLKDWCRAQREHCAEDPIDWCEERLARCPAEEEEEEEDGFDLSALGNDVGGPSEGCNITRAGSSRALTSWFGLGLLALALRRRRHTRA